MSLTNKTINGVFWTFLEQLLQRGTSVVVTLLLARFLSPEHYGLMAMMAVFLAIANSIVDSGFSQALIRKQNVRQQDYNTAFYANLALSLLAYLLLFACAPLIAGFYEQPQLTVLIRAAGTVILINAFRLVQVVILTKELNFKAQLQATIPSSLVSGLLAILLAYAGWGVWALVAQMITSALLLNIILWSLSAWRPSLKTDKDSLQEMYGFGYKLFLSGLIDTIFNNIYVVVIAKLFSTTIAGYYFFADKIKELVISQLVTSIQKVTYPALTSKQDDDEKLKEGYRKVIQATTFLLFPAMSMMAAIAQPLFEVLLPVKWLPAVPYLQLMCLAALLYPVNAINLNILKVKGRSDLFLSLEIVKKVMAACILAFSYRYGIYGILCGQIASSLLAYIPNSFYSRRLINYPVAEQLKDFMPALLLSLAMAGSILLAMDQLNLAALPGLFLFPLAGITLYLLCAKLFRLQGMVICQALLKPKIRMIMAIGGRK